MEMKKTASKMETKPIHFFMGILLNQIAYSFSPFKIQK